MLHIDHHFRNLLLSWQKVSQLFLFFPLIISTYRANENQRSRWVLRVAFQTTCQFAFIMLENEINFDCFYSRINNHNTRIIQLQILSDLEKAILPKLGSILLYEYFAVWCSVWTPFSDISKQINNQPFFPSLSLDCFQELSYYQLYFIRMKMKQNKSQSKYGSLIVKTNHQTTFDSRWSELKIDGKNIPSRSNHIAAFFNSKLYVHGGYDADRGVLSDFSCIDIADDCQYFQWKKLNNTINGQPLKLKNHTGVVYKTLFIVFGGELPSNQSSNNCYAFDFVDSNWKKIKSVNGQKVPKVDSHSAYILDSKMYVYGGYIPDKAQYLRSIYCLDLEKMEWSVVFQSKNSKDQPEGRSNLSMVGEGQNLYVFGGTNGEKTLNDMWKFSLTQKKWTNLQHKNTPEARRGHSMIVYKGYIFLFGGIQDITKQKNDIYAFQISSGSWNKIHTSTNSVYECSPTLKQQRKKSPSKSPDKITLHKVQTEKNTDRNEDVMKKILTQNKQKKFLEKKKQLLRQFSQKPAQYNKNRSLSPTTESMLKTLESIGNQEVTKKQLKQQIMYDQSHRYIIGKKPCARDGQSVVVFKQKMYIFGGDRHLMAFNDLYSFDLEKGLTSIDLYKNN